MKCLITGCDLIDMQTQRWCHGDLYRVGDSYIFNTCLEDGETAWQYSERCEDTKFLTIHTSLGLNYFERRGVIVVSCREATLNQSAKDYIQRGSYACWGSDAQC